MSVRQFLMEQGLKQMRKRTYFDPNYSVETYLNKIPMYFDPAKAKDRRLVVVYEFHDSGHNDGAWTVTIEDGKCTLTKGEAEEYESKFYMTADTYHRILTGQLDAVRLAYSVGAIRFFGNTIAHRELNSYLTIPKEARLASL